MKGTLAFAVIAILCLSMFSAYAPKVNAQQSSGTGDPTAKVTQLWEFTPPSSRSSEVYAPVVADGYVYFTSEESEGVPLTLYCLDASTGTQIWNYTGSQFSFTVANGNIYVGGYIDEFTSAGAGFTFKGVVSCLNAYNGAQLWNYTYGTDFGSPVVVGGIVYVGGTDYTESTDTNVGFVYAFNASTGAEIWNYLGSVGISFDGNSLVVSDENVYAASAVYSQEQNSYNSAVYAFNAYSGKELWNYTTPGQFSSLVNAGQNIYVSSNFENTTGQSAQNPSGNVYQGGDLALDASNGTRIWDYPISSSVGSPIVANGTVHVVAGNGNVYALDASDGRVIWKYATGLSTGSSLLVNGYLYVGSSDGVYCFDAYDGAVIWNFKASDFADSSATNPTYADGVVYVGWNGPMFFSPVTQHNFYALEAVNGKKLWNYTLGCTVASSPVVVDGTVYVAATFVTSQSPDSESAGAVLALNSTVTSVPLLSSPPTSEGFSASMLTLIAIGIVAVVIVAAVVVLMFQKRLKTKTTSPPTTPQNSTSVASVQIFQR